MIFSIEILVLYILVESLGVTLDRNLGEEELHEEFKDWHILTWFSTLRIILSILIV